MVDSTNRRRFLAASGITVVGLSGCLGSSDDDDEEPTQADSSENGTDDANPNRTIQWGGLGSENATQDCPDELGYWKWVLTPGGPEPLEEATLTVVFSDDTEQTVEGFFPGGGRGAIQFEVFKEGGGTVESASVEFSGGGANPRLTISEGRCVPDEDVPPELTVVTEPATDVNASTATLNGFLTDLGDFDDVDVFFEYREVGDTEWLTTESQTLDEPGPFSAEIDVEPGVEYEFRTVAEANDQRVTGAVESFTKDEEPVTKPTVVTGPATDVNESTATLNGELLELGDFDDVDVFFEYRPIGADEWLSTEPQTFDEPGPFSAEIDVEQGVEYEFRAVAETNDTVSIGEFQTFTKEVPDKDLPRVATEPATDVNESTATLNGRLITLGDFEEVEVFFQYRLVGADEWLETEPQLLMESGPFSDEISGLVTGTVYEFRAIAVADDTVVAGPIQRFTKDEPDEPDEKKRRKEEAKKDDKTDVKSDE